MITHIPLKIQEIVQETPTTRSFVFHHRPDVNPGQFFMVTDFEHGEKPFSVSSLTDTTFSITVRSLGSFSSRLNQLSAGDTLYVRGPYGNAFSLPTKFKNIVIVGGGCGTAPLRFLMQTLWRKNIRIITFINGAKTRSELLYRQRLDEVNIRSIFVTDDGSDGKKQNSAEALHELLQKEKFDLLYTAGPEPMMKNIYDLCLRWNLKGQFLLERYIKCGVGICGSCTLDPAGIRLCVEGPVLDTEQLGSITEFGNYHRDASGTRVPAQSCAY